MSFWDTPTKDVPRRYVMQKRLLNGRRRAVKNALSLPGSHLLCVLAGFASGLFDRHTYHIFVEKDPAVQRQINHRQRQIQSEWTPRFWWDAIEKLPLRAALQNQPLEFAFLDFCCALNPAIARWIYTELGPALADNATVAFTLSRNWRRSPYMKWWTGLIANRNREARLLWQQTDAMIRDAECTGVVGDMSRFYDDADFQSSDSYMVLPSRSKWGRFLRPEYHDASVDALSALSVLLPYHSFKLEACIEYQRDPAVRTAMTTYVLTDFQKLTHPRIGVNLLNALGENVSPKMRPVAF